MRQRSFLLSLTLVILLFSSCESVHEIAYVYDAKRDVQTPLKGDFFKGIQPNDLLGIYVESETPSAVVQFNQETNKIAIVEGQVMNPGSNAVTGYLVNQSGDIIFPVLGKLHVLGLTHDELGKMIERRLIDEGHLKDPVVSIKLMNFKVSVLGEVAKPGQIIVSGERVTIFEALSMVGDINIQGQRHNVTVIREENGMRTIGTIDLTSETAFESPYYYLHQNDVIYVEPNIRKKKAAERDPIVLSYISSAVSIISVCASVFYYYILSKNLSK